MSRSKREGFPFGLPLEGTICSISSIRDFAYEKLPSPSTTASNALRKFCGEEKKRKSKSDAKKSNNIKLNENSLFSCMNVLKKVVTRRCAYR